MVLSGGEPTLDPNLEAHARLARELGFEQVVVETNALLLVYPGRADRLRAAGVTRLRVAINDLRSRSDALTGVRGAFSYTLEGTRKAMEVGIPVEISTALTRVNAGSLPAIIEFVGRELHGIEGCLIRVVSEPPRWSAPYARVAPSVAEATRLGAELGLDVRLDGRAGIPLCFFPQRTHYPELFSSLPSKSDKHERIEECDLCAADAVCAGVPRAYLEAHGPIGALHVPAKEGRLVRGLGRDRKEAVERELVCDNMLIHNRGASYVIERVLRVNFHCNQDCGFCFVDRTLPPVSSERVESEIDRAAKDGVYYLSISGGEPTLDPRLFDYVRRASGLGFAVRLQTNAIRCARPGYARELASAGVARAYVSLHGATPEVSDAITAAPGTFEKTLAGIDELLTAGVAVTLNCVITGSNYRDLPNVCRLISDRWGGRPVLTISWAHASTDVVPLDEEVVPKVSLVRPYLARAIRICEEAGTVWQGLEGECGLPLCLLDSEWLELGRFPPVPPPNPPPGFIKAEQCNACGMSDRCIGLRDSYVELHGTDELRPMPRRGVE